MATKSNFACAEELTLRVSDSIHQIGGGHESMPRFATRSLLAPNLVARIAGRSLSLNAAEDDSEINASATLTLDSEVGLHCDSTFHTEVCDLRRQGFRLCEITGLTVDVPGTVAPLYVGASMLHVCHLFAHRIQQATHALIHVKQEDEMHYVQGMGFSRVKESTAAHGENSPTVLLIASSDFVQAQIQKKGGKGVEHSRLDERTSRAKSLYPYFYAKDEAEGIHRRLSRFLTSLSAPRSIL
ncbi:N-acyl amino acid synthase FeeM domain-containing protein [Paucibacter soli]|uniref:N-acyl amino acid synthase FeeM domain-containing protein n=1 Tax=Paucibacter soli TaxID=3133433 RepID=UPI00309C2C83